MKETRKEGTNEERKDSEMERKKNTRKQGSKKGTKHETKETDLYFSWRLPLGALHVPENVVLGASIVLIRNHGDREHHSFYGPCRAGVKVVYEGRLLLLVPSSQVPHYRAHPTVGQGSLEAT